MSELRTWHSFLPSDWFVSVPTPSWSAGPPRTSPRSTESSSASRSPGERGAPCLAWPARSEHSSYGIPTWPGMSRDSVTLWQCDSVTVCLTVLKSDSVTPPTLLLLSIKASWLQSATDKNRHHVLHLFVNCLQWAGWQNIQRNFFCLQTCHLRVEDLHPVLGLPAGHQPQGGGARVHRGGDDQRRRWDWRLPSAWIVYSNGNNLNRHQNYFSERNCNLHFFIALPAIERHFIYCILRTFIWKLYTGISPFLVS